MERSSQRDLQHVGLATACAVIYWEITGQIPDPGEPAEMQSILNDIALQVSKLVPIYAAQSASGVPEPHERLQLTEGRFLRGAQVFKLNNGEEMRDLTIRRGDMEEAIKVVKSAGIKFR